MISRRGLLLGALALVADEPRRRLWPGWSQPIVFPDYSKTRFGRQWFTIGPDSVADRAIIEISPEHPAALMFEAFLRDPERNQLRRDVWRYLPSTVIINPSVHSGAE